MTSATIHNVQGQHRSTGLFVSGTQRSLESMFAGVSCGTQVAESTSLPVRVISQLGAPRWVLPADVRRAIPILKSWRPYSAQSRLKWSAIVGACRIGALHKLPGVVCEEFRCDLSYWRQHLPEYSDSWAIVAYIGNPSPTRKALLFFIDETARVRAVVKVPIHTAAKAAILNESAVLKKVQNRLPVPRVLFSDEIEGIAAQSWVQGRNVSLAFGREHLKLLMSLASDHDCIPLYQRRKEIEVRLAQSPFAGSSYVQRALSLLDIKEGVRECVEHGDFTPWNLRRLQDGQLIAIDWEWSIESGLPWQDICRYFYLKAYLFSEAGNVWHRLKTNPLLAEYRQQFDLSPQAVRGLTIYFQLRFLCDQHEDGNQAKVEYAVKKIHEVLNG